MKTTELNHTARSFDELVHLFDASFNTVDFQAGHPEAHQGTHFFFQKRGKRLRPVLCMMTYEMLGGDAANAVHASIALELFHSFTLIHDDILDDASTRRGQSTVFRQFGLGNAIVTGDSVMIEAYHQLALQNHKNLHALIAQFNESSVHVLEGQQLDIELEGKTGVKQDEYLTMIEYKTAALFGACLKIGGILANASAKELTYLYQAGRNLGMAFQLMDDLLDAFGSEESFGKKIGGDIIQNKNTILAVKTWEASGEENRRKLLEIREITDNEEKIQRTLAMFRAARAGEQAKALMEDYYKRALQNLDRISVPEENKQVLKGCFQEILQRTQ